MFGREIKGESLASCNPAFFTPLRLSAPFSPQISANRPSSSVRLFHLPLSLTPRHHLASFSFFSPYPMYPFPSRSHFRAPIHTLSFTFPSPALVRPLCACLSKFRRHLSPRAAPQTRTSLARNPFVPSSLPPHPPLVRLLTLPSLLFSYRDGLCS